MTFLAPGALIWLASIPVLLWLWRLASTRRQSLIPSLIPFEHLLRRAPKRRSRLVVTLLFWLQLAALLGLTAALARPVLMRPRARTVLVLLDTSASMGARAPGLFGGGATAFERAQRALLSRLARKSPADQWLVVTTAPVASLTPQPTSDAATLRQAIERARVAHLGGNLATAAHIGRMLLAAEPDRTLVATDEARPAEQGNDRLQWATVGAPAPNAALVGLDAQGPLCRAAEASVVATVQNFSDEEAGATLTASQGGRRLAETAAAFAPGERQSLALALPDDAAGWVEIALAAKRDGLEADNRAWINLFRGATAPIALRPHTAAFKETLSSWLGACETLTWTMEDGNGPPAAPGGEPLVITDRWDAAQGAAASMVFEPPSPSRPLLSRWVVASGHPIGSYLAPVETASAALNLSPWTGSGVVVVAALVNGRKVPVVVADEREGLRTVVMRLDPSHDPGSTPVLLAFFNSLRWLMGTSADTMGGPANFFDPVESNLLHRASTWRTNRDRFPFPIGQEWEKESGPGTISSAGRTAQPLSRALMLAMLVVLLIEWWRYTEKRDHFPFPTLTRQEKRSGPTTLAARP